MKGDFSRDVFDAAKHYSAVLLEQGGLLTDSDWKEHADLVRHRIERETLDVVGACGGPVGAAAFALAAGSQPLAIETNSGSPALFWITTADGFVLRSSDAGATWTVVDTASTKALHAIRFVGATGWVVGARGAILHSPDLGATWTKLDAGVATHLRGIAAVGSSNVWIVGDGGAVISSSDASAHWARANAGSAQLNAIAFQSPTRGVIVGHGGAVYTTTDGGVTWTSRASGVTADLFAVAFLDVANIWAAGEGGTILHSADGGLTWAAQASGVSTRLAALSFTSITTGVAVGDGGTLLRTADGGTTWTAVAIGFDDDLRGAVLIGNDVWFIGEGPTSHRISLLTGTPGAVALPALGFSIGAGRYYVRGTLCEVETLASYYNQPDRGVVPRLAPGEHVVYVQAWQRLLCALEAPSIREVALGEADPSTRAKTVWQVKTLPLPAISPPSWNCLSTVPGLDELAWPPLARLVARAEPQVQATSLCDVGAAAGYRRLENQLYRVEIQEGGATPRFKWSRENGSVAFGIERIDPPSAGSPVETAVSLKSRARDNNLELSTGDWVEIINDDLALEDRVGPLFRFLRDGSDRMEIVLAGAVPATLAADPERHPLLRRWDHRTPGGDSSVALAEGSWLDLEEGVQIFFEPGGVYRPGDYWLIPARTVTGDVEWPRDASGTPLPQPPEGIENRICRLGLIEVAADGAVTVKSDCRNLFPPLTSLEQLLYVSGDGQEALPGQVLAQPLMVRVARGKFPVAGAVVRFEIASGAGTIVGPPVGVSIDVTTDANGLAQCEWTLDADLALAAQHQTLRASLLDAGGSVLPGAAVLFSANASFSLAHVGGDGQQGASGSALEQPLEVRVANNQVPFAAAQINFVVIAGGGAITSANPAATSATGIASATWQLGASGPQRVEAQLVDGGGAVVQHVAFNAQVVTASAGGGGCAVTVGEGGDVPQLDADTLKQLLEEHRGQLCLCFLAGRHRVDGLEISGSGETRLSIHGCGHASRIEVIKPWILEKFDTIDISNVAVDLLERASLTFRGVADVSLASLDVRVIEDREDPAFAFQVVSRARIADTRIRLPGVALSVLFDDADAVVEVCGSDINGIVSFYGLPATAHLPLLKLPVDDLLARLNAGGIRMSPGKGRLRLQSNRFDVLALGRDMAAQISNAANGAGVTIDGLIADALVVGNSFGGSVTQFAAYRLSLSSNAFMAKPTDGELAVFIAEGAAAASNVADEIGDHAILRLITPAGFAQKSANLIFIMPP